MSTHQNFQPDLVTPPAAKTLVEALQEAAQHILATADDRVGHKDRAWLHDLCREDAGSRGFGFKALERLIVLIARAGNPMILAEIIRAQTLQEIATPHLCPVTEMVAEADAELAANKAGFHWFVERTPIARDAAVEAYTGHEYAIRRFKDALHLARPRGRTVVS